MTNSKIKPLILSLSIATFLTTSTYPVIANPVETTQNVKTEATEKKLALQAPVAKKATYKLIDEKTECKQAVVYIGNQEVVKYTLSAGGYTPEVRAKILVSRINNFLNKNGNPKDILPGIEGGIPVGRAKGDMLFTADSAIAKEMGIKTNELAIQWVNNIRTALGAPKITRDIAKVASRSGISIEAARKAALKQENGMASWYGGHFHGRRAADGSTFNKNNYTAAHKTLPLGSYVKVTNLKNNKSCIVKITDRGPFVHGRIIDVSSEAAKHLEMISSGVANVKIQVVNSF